MQLSNAFDVAATPGRVWTFILDPERVVPCMPGAELVGVVSGAGQEPEGWEVEAKIKALGYPTHSHADYEPGRRFYFDDENGIEFEVVSYA